MFLLSFVPKYPYNVGLINMINMGFRLKNNVAFAIPYRFINLGIEHVCLIKNIKIIKYHVYIFMIWARLLIV